MWFNLKILGTVAIAIVLLGILPYWILGSDAIFEIHDNLDSDVVWFTVTSQSGELLSFSNTVKIDQYMNGLPRNSLMPGLNFISFLFYLFPPIWALLINFTLVRLTAFGGMSILLKDYLFKDRGQEVFSLGVGVCYALLPYWGVHSGLGIAGLPIVAWSFLNLFHSKQVRLSIFILVLFPFYASLIYTGIFYLIILGAIWLYHVLKKREVNILVAIGLAAHSFSYLLAELNLFSQLISGNMVSHRTERVVSGLNLNEVFDRSWDLFLNGQYHAPTQNSPVLISLIGISLLFALFSYLRNRKISHPARISFKFLLLIIGISLFYGFWLYHPVVDLTDKHKFLKIIQWDRFHWLLPFFWFILFAFSYRVLLDDIKGKWLRVLLLTLILSQIYHSFSINNKLKTNYLVAFSDYQPDVPSFREYYACDLFDSVNEYIGIPKSDYRVISVGLHPEIAAASGFYTLDSYQRNYPLSYKHQFGEAISPEINRNKLVANYFNLWGSRCYAFSSELGLNYLWGQECNKMINRLMYDYTKLEKMNCRYIISAVPINPDNNPELEFLRAFENDDSYWKLYLYKIRSHHIFDSL